MTSATWRAFWSYEGSWEIQAIVKPNWRTAPWRLKAWLGKEVLTGGRDQRRPQGSLPAAPSISWAPQDSSSLREKPQNTIFGTTFPSKYNTQTPPSPLQPAVKSVEWWGGRIYNLGAERARRPPPFRGLHGALCPCPSAPNGGRPKRRAARETASRECLWGAVKNYGLLKVHSVFVCAK